MNIPHINNGERLETGTVGKANALNSQFQSVFVTEGSDQIHDKGPSPYSQMPLFTIDTNGYDKLLQNLNVNKATGPDNVNACILKELRAKTAPILTFTFRRSFETGIAYLMTGKGPTSFRFSKKVNVTKHLTISLCPSPASLVR